MVLQRLGINEPQARKKTAVLRIISFCLWLNSVVKLWSVPESRHESTKLLENDPWHPHNDTISFQDTLSALRLHFRPHYIVEESTSHDNCAKIRDFTLKSLGNVA